jgi:hypothetical protein
MKISKKKIEDDLNLDNLNTFEEVIKENYNDTLILDILKPEQIVDNNCKSLTIALGEGFQPLRLFHDKHSKEYSFLTLFFEHQRPSFNCSYQKIVQVELTSVNKFVYHITNIFFKTKNIDSFHIIFHMDSYSKRKIIELYLNS